jgi:HAD superfamily hydrolase (TIGR01509 family)
LPKREALFRPAGVIFDMDGLMLDTERPLIAAWERAAGEAGWRLDGETLAETIGIDEPSTRKLMMKNCGRDFPYDVIRDSAERVYTEYVEKHGIPLRPGLLALRGYLDRLGIPVAVATSSARSIALRKLELAGIEGRFPLLVCGDEIRRGKPAPDIFLRAAELLGKSPAECLGFEDSPAGLRALKAAGIRSVFIRDTVEPAPEMLASVWLRLNSLDEAIPLIGKSEPNNI